MSDKDPCKDEHRRIVLDRFHFDFGVARYLPGDCYCLDCDSPVPYWWNHGKPRPVNEVGEH